MRISKQAKKKFMAGMVGVNVCHCLGLSFGAFHLYRKQACHFIFILIIF